MKAPVIFISFLFFCFTACAHSKVWVKTTGDPSTFDVDMQDCQVKANQAGYPPSNCNPFVSGSCSYESFVITCMKTKGWHQRRE